MNSPLCTFSCLLPHQPPLPPCLYITGFQHNDFNNIAKTSTTFFSYKSKFRTDPLRVVQLQAKPYFPMAVFTSFLTACFSGSSSTKVASEGDDSPRLSTEVKAGNDVKSKESKAKSKRKKSHPIPVSYFAVGPNFSRL
ncbi:hypothetical protein V6N11_032787 [Hibiscus sabdariffa]|uniref:Uncharacterized protein n=1 Tax=Hibiscus sabdariffa TaxID=183260 RepID=A0ABR2T1Q8_9ROSI